MTTDVALVFDFHSLSRQARWSEDSLVTDENTEQHHHMPSFRTRYLVLVPGTLLDYRSYDDDTEFEVFTKSFLVPGTTPMTIVGSRYLVPPSSHYKAASRAKSSSKRLFIILNPNNKYKYVLC